MNIVGTQGKKMVEVSAIVIRCGCSPTQRRRATWHGNVNQPCPKPQDREDLGVIAYWHQNPLRRFAQWARRAIGA